MTRRTFAQTVAAGLARAASAPAVLDPENLRPYVDDFNRTYKEEVVNHIPDSQSWEWMKENIPLFACPDRDVEQTYYFRWWTYRKHIKQTPAGFIVTEFLKPVNHAGEFNALSCAFGHHVAEGRWLHDARYMDQYIRFWLRTGENGGMRKNFHQFSGWAAAALWERFLTDGNRAAAVDSLDALRADFTAWEQERQVEGSLFWQRDVSDGMEESISGGRRVKNIRPSINSYMYGNARALAAIAELTGQGSTAVTYQRKAAEIKAAMQARLWNPKARFFETVTEAGAFSDVREEIGFTPWYFGLPDDREEYSDAWKQLMDPAGFLAPFGPTTAEQRHPQFQIPYQGDDCQWNGPSWPFSTTITLRALANVLQTYRYTGITRDDYFHAFLTYTKSQRLTLEDGRIVPWIDENLNPRTGEWLARANKLRKKTFYGRGDHYNHSGYGDLVITGLAGLRPRADVTVEVNPLAPDQWDWFCVDRVRYHGRMLSIIWDKTGKRFGKGPGLKVLANGKEIARSPRLARITGQL